MLSKVIPRSTTLDQRCLSCRPAILLFAITKLSSPFPVERRYPRAIGHFIRVETRRVQLFWTMARQQRATGTTAASRFRLRLSGRGEEFCIFTRSSAPTRPCITHQPSRSLRGVAFAFCSPLVVLQFLRDNLYEKYSSPFAIPSLARGQMSAKKPRTCNLSARVSVRQKFPRVSRCVSPSLKRRRRRDLGDAGKNSLVNIPSHSSLPRFPRGKISCPSTDSGITDV